MAMTVEEHPSLLSNQRMAQVTVLLAVLACALFAVLLQQKVEGTREAWQQAMVADTNRLRNTLQESAQRGKTLSPEQGLLNHLQRGTISALIWREEGGGVFRVAADTTPSPVPVWFAAFAGLTPQQRELVVEVSGRRVAVLRIELSPYPWAMQLWSHFLLSLMALLLGIALLLIAMTARLRQQLSLLQEGPPAGAHGSVRTALGGTSHLAAVVGVQMDAMLDGREGMMVTDANGTILRVNRAFSTLTGYSEAEVVGSPASLLKSERHDKTFYREMWAALLAQNHWEGEIWNKRKNGEIFPEWLSISAATKGDGSISHFVASFSDISERKEAEERIQYLAFYDSLTQLPNRRLLLDRLTLAISSSSRSGHWGAMLFIDLDHFKKLNDTRGHEVGDLLLVEVAGRIQARIRQDDTVARLGGDEFVVILGNLGMEHNQSATAAERVADEIGASLGQCYLFNGFEHYATASIGVTLFHGDKVSAQEMLRQADIAMYQAKSAGRNTVRFFEPNMQAILDTRLLMEGELRQALAGGELQLYYQLQVDSSDTAIGAEVLLRWHQPQRGMIPPNHFIPVAEDSGLIVPIGNWVLQSACEKLKQWENEPMLGRLQLAVNVSARQFRQHDFTEQVIGIIEGSEIAPSRLKLELTESMVLDDMVGSIRKMEQLKSYGVSFSMDDFGTGHSSLSYLKRLPLDQMKIDQSFVRDIALDPNDAVLVKTIIAMGRNLGLDVIAEGVETEAQWRYLVDHGCGAFQGYLFGRPLPVEKFEELVRNWAAEQNRAGGITTECRR